LNPGVGVLLDQKHWRNRQVWKQSDELTQVETVLNHFSLYLQATRNTGKSSEEQKVSIVAYHTSRPDNRRLWGSSTHTHRNRTVRTCRAESRGYMWHRQYVLKYILVALYLD